MQYSIPFIVMSIWDMLIDPFVDLSENLLGNPLLIGAVILLFFIMFMLVLFIPFEAQVTIYIPMFFIVFEYIPSLRIVIAIIVGIGIGLGLIKWVRR